MGTTKKAIYIGNKDTFAIKYKPDFSSFPTENYPHTHHFAFCHFIFRGYLIGIKEENCYLSTWKYAFEWYIYLFKYEFETISSPIFNDKTDEELWVLMETASILSRELLIKKSREMTSILTHEELNELKSMAIKCFLSIDETTDRFAIYLLGMGDDIKIIWKIYRGRKLRSVTLKRAFIIETMEDCIRQIETDYPDLAYYWTKAYKLYREDT